MFVTEEWLEQLLYHVHVAMAVFANIFGKIIINQTQL